MRARVVQASAVAELERAVRDAQSFVESRVRFGRATVYGRRRELEPRLSADHTPIDAALRESVRFLTAVYTSRDWHELELAEIDAVIEAIKRAEGARMTTGGRA